MKKVLFTIIYPIWFFFSQTFVGCVIVFNLVLILPGYLIDIASRNTGNVTGNDAVAVAVGELVFCIFLSPFMAVPLVAFSCYLEEHYEKWGYKTQMQTLK